eukprot:scaffold4096_cov237-Pinguiococcus_pyrenoidosus.AAC.3
MLLETLSLIDAPFQGGKEILVSGNNVRQFQKSADAGGDRSQAQGSAYDEYTDVQYGDTLENHSRGTNNWKPRPPFEGIMWPVTGQKKYRYLPLKSPPLRDRHPIEVIAKLPSQGLRKKERGAGDFAVCAYNGLDHGLKNRSLLLDGVLDVFNGFKNPLRKLIQIASLLRQSLNGH